MPPKSRARRLVANLAVVGLAVAIVEPPATAAGATTKRVSVRTSGIEALGGESGKASISANGRFVAFGSSAGNLVAGDTNDLEDIFVHDRWSGTTRRINLGPGGIEALGGDSFVADISANGRYVTFHSEAGNLVAGDSNGVADIFLFDRWRKRTKRISLRTGGAQANDESRAPSISVDGRLVAFGSRARNLVRRDRNGHFDVFVRGPLR